MQPYNSRRSSTREWKENPVAKLTVGLLSTYRRINKSYYEAKTLYQQQQQLQLQAAAANPRDDADYDYIIRAGDELKSDTYHYRLDGRIGKGSFGQVASAVDLLHGNKPVAIKIIKSKPPFTKQAQEEIRLLEMLNGRNAHIVRLLNKFMHHNHQCLVFEKLSTNLYDLLRNTKFQGVSFELIRKFAKHILSALEFLREEHVIHCDLKPENILLCEPKRSMLKVIDFGSSCMLEHRPYTYIQSRFYRAPEIILGLEYTCAIDMWSLGCILIEMHTGEPLFSGQNEREQMHHFVGALGMPPAEMIQLGKNSAKFFHDNWELRKLDHGKQVRMQTVDQALGIPPNSSRGGTKTTPFAWWQIRPQGFEGIEKYREFSDFVSQMLMYAPSQRITPTDALQHRFLESPTMYYPPPAASGGTATTTAQDFQVPHPTSASSSPQSTGSASQTQQDKGSPRRPSKRQFSQ